MDDMRQQQQLAVAVGRVHQLEDEILQLRSDMAPLISMLSTMVRKFGVDNRVTLDAATIKEFAKDNGQLAVDAEADGAMVLRVVVTQRVDPPGRRLVEVVPAGAMPMASPKV